MRKQTISSAFFAGAMLLASVAGAFLDVPAGMAHHLAPRPSLVTRSWQIDFQNSIPHRLIVVRGKGAAQHVIKYWFMTYTVVNNTHKDLFFNPQLELMADNGKILEPVAAVAPRLFKKIKAVSASPFLINPMLIAGRLLQGADNAKQSVVVFTNLPPVARGFRVFVSGLSGETAVQKDPVTGDNIVLHKTLVLHYWIPGHSIHMTPKPILLSHKWVMK